MKQFSITVNWCCKTSSKKSRRPPPRGRRTTAPTTTTTTTRRRRRPFFCGFFERRHRVSLSLLSRCAQFFHSILRLLKRRDKSTFRKLYQNTGSGGSSFFQSSSFKDGTKREGEEEEKSTNETRTTTTSRTTHERNRRTKSVLLYRGIYICRRQHTTTSRSLLRTLLFRPLRTYFC